MSYTKAIFRHFTLFMEAQNAPIFIPREDIEKNAVASSWTATPTGEEPSEKRRVLVILKDKPYICAPKLEIATPEGYGRAIPADARDAIVDAFVSSHRKELILRIRERQVLVAHLQDRIRPHHLGSPLIMGFVSLLLETGWEEDISYDHVNTFVFRKCVLALIELTDIHTPDRTLEPRLWADLQEATELGYGLKVQRVAFLPEPSRAPKADTV